jgi:hypothetical protein
MTPPTKTCNTCNIPKPLSAFRKNLRYADGREGRCKKCLAERTAELNAQKAVGADFFDDKKGAF